VLNPSDVINFKAFIVILYRLYPTDKPCNVLGIPLSKSILFGNGEKFELFKIVSQKFTKSDKSHVCLCF